MIPIDKIAQSIPIRICVLQARLIKLTEAMRLGSPFIIKPTKKQSGGFLCTLHASIGVPLLLKVVTGNGIQGYSRYCKCQFLTLVILCNCTSLSEHLRSHDCTKVHSTLGQTSLLSLFFCFVHTSLLYG